MILPERTGPIADVLYSAAGNSADDQWYRKGIISYSFETGADRFITNPTTGAVTQIRPASSPASAGVGTGGGKGACNANLINEGRDQAMEFANGNYGMVESAYDYAMDTTAPKHVDRVLRRADGAVSRSTTGSTGTTRPRSSTTRPTARRRPCPRATYNNQRARSIGEVLTLTTPGAYTIKWMAVDIKGNQSAVQTPAPAGRGR